jgi:cell division protein FtsL
MSTIHPPLSLVGRWFMGIIGSLMAGLALATVLGGVSWLTSMYTLTQHHGEKIAVLESQLSDQRRQLDRIDQKIDQLLRRDHSNLHDDR